MTIDDIYAQRVTYDGERKSLFTVAACGNSRIMPEAIFNQNESKHLAVYMYDAHGV